MGGAPYLGIGGPVLLLLGVISPLLHRGFRRGHHFTFRPVATPDATPQSWMPTAAMTSVHDDEQCWLYSNVGLHVSQPMQNPDFFFGKNFPNSGRFHWTPSVTTSFFFYSIAGKVGSHVWTFSWPTRFLPQSTH